MRNLADVGTLATAVMVKFFTYQNSNCGLFLPSHCQVLAPFINNLSEPNSAINVLNCYYSVFLAYITL